MNLHLCPPVAFSDTFSHTQPHPTMSAAKFHSAELYSKDKNIFELLPPNLTAAGPRRGADQPALHQPGDGQQQGACLTMTAAANIAFPSTTFDLIPTTAVSSNEVRVSLHSREDSDGERRSRPVTRVRGESIVSVSRSTAGDAEYYFSEDMDRNVLQDMQVKAPLSREESIK